MAMRRVDEFDGITDAEVVEWSFEGATYEIDLSPDSKQKFIRDLERYINASRRVGTRAAKKSAKRTTPVTSKPAPERAMDLDAVRSWGRQKGMKVSDRGRIPKDVTAAFEAAHTPNAVDPAFSATN